MRPLRIFCLISLLVIAFGTVQLFSQQRTKYRSGVFLHHSTGGCIWGPKGSSTSIPLEIENYNTLHVYTDSDAVTMNEIGWPVDPWNNEWERWHNIFENQDATANIQSYLASNSIIVIKSCFPSSSMSEWGEPADTISPTVKSMYNYKWHWRHFISVMRNHPENFFAVWTNAPLVAGATNDEEALLSDKFCRWANDTLAKGLDREFGIFPDNVYVFDFFHKLADSNGKLPLQYASSSGDSHPNGAATSLVAPLFVQEIFDAAIAYEPLAVLHPPLLNYPPDGAVNLKDTLRFIWERSSEADNYQFQLAVDSLFIPTVYDDSLITDISILMQSLEHNKKYYWRVRAKNDLTISMWSSVWKFTTAGDSGFQVYVSKGWNMLSLPLIVDHPSAKIIFPTATSNRFYYRKAYVDSDSLDDGMGFWIKFGYDQIIQIVGDSIYSDTIDVLKGWNLIGSLSAAFPVSSINTIPEDLLGPNVFGYEKSYILVDTIEPGKGYWVKAKDPGKIIFTVTP